LASKKHRLFILERYLSDRDGVLLLLRYVQLAKSFYVHSFLIAKLSREENEFFTQQGKGEPS
jgi:hypothetical protein